MGRRGRNNGGTERSYTTDPRVLIGTCGPCGKKMFLSRKVARQAARKTPPGEGGSRPRAYECPYQDQVWHVGHLPDAVRQGEIDRDRYAERRKPPGGAP